MNVVRDSVQDGLRDRGFELEVDGRRVPVALWSPIDMAPSTPVVVIGHGGGGHKRMRTVSGLAERLVREHGIAAFCIDAVEHGDRVGGPIVDREAALAEREKRRVNPLEDLYHQMIVDWTATLDAVQSLPGLDGPVGFFGLSMGTRYGLPWLAVERRVHAAVFGLNGITPDDDGNPDQVMVKRLFSKAAPAIAVPLTFLVQQGDALFPRVNSLALFDLFGTTEKRLRLNPGGHFDVPLGEFADGAAFLAQHLQP